MGRDQLCISETGPILKVLDDISYRSGISRGKVFDDFLAIIVCALAGGTMEEEYLSVIGRYTEGEKGRRGCDLLAQAFAMLIEG